MQQLGRKYVLTLVAVVLSYLSFMSMLGLNTTKKVVIYVDGIEHQIDTKVIFAKDAIDDFTENAVDGDYIASENDYHMISNQAVIDVQTKRSIELLINNEIVTITTYKNLVSEILEEKNNELVNKDLEASRAASAIEDQEVKTERYILNGIDGQMHLNEVQGPIEMIRETFVEQSHIIDIPANVTYQYTRSLDVGQERVIQEGVSQIQVERHFYYYRNDVLIETKTTVEEVQQAGAPTIIEKGINSTIAPVQPYGVWDELSYCEAGGRWDANTGNGFSGGLQWSAATWNKAASAVGLGHIPYAYLATRDEQILAAQAWLERTSWAQWPSCSTKLGLR